MTQRNTVQRTIILDALRDLANHPTAGQVYEAVHAQHPTISKATVYRTLGRLADEGIVLRVRINNGADHFDHQTFEHSHIRCVGCGRVDDVEVSPMEGVDEAAAASSGYKVRGHVLQFDGLCPACQRDEARRA